MEQRINTSDLNGQGKLIDNNTSQELMVTWLTLVYCLN
jgi:hypothetical protein